MRAEQHVVQRRERVAAGKRLLVIDVESGGGDMSRVQAGEQRVLFDDLAARRVDDDDTGFGELEGFRVE